MNLFNLNDGRTTGSMVVTSSSTASGSTAFFHHWSGRRHNGFDNDKVFLGYFSVNNHLPFYRWRNDFKLFLHSHCYSFLLFDDWGDYFTLRNNRPGDWFQFGNCIVRNGLGRRGSTSVSEVRTCSESGSARWVSAASKAETLTSAPLMTKAFSPSTRSSTG